MPEREHRRAAGHGLDHGQAERLRPIDGKEQGQRFPEKLGLGALIDLADILHAGLIDERRDLLPEIDLVRLVDFGRDLQRDSERPGELDGAVGTLFRRDAADERQIATTRLEYRLIEMLGDAVVDGGHKVGVGDRPPLGVRDRYQRHIAKADVEWLQIGQILPAMDRGYGALGVRAKERKMKLIDMEVKKVELLGGRA